MTTYADKSIKVCPYDLARILIKQADIIVYNYQYLLDPRIESMIPKDLTKNYVVVFDKACDIDDFSVKILTIRLN
jgi:DNA excision repair protein ERCC-2